MAKNVSFKCTCPQSVGRVRVFQNAGDNNPLEVLLFLQSGTRTARLDPGAYLAIIDALGAPNTAFAIELSGGGEMKALGVTLPFDGRLSRNRKVVVA
jgi:hypothetical protein